MLLSLDFMPPDQIGHMSLNGLKRRVATCDKTQTRTRMGEPSVSLDLENWVSTNGGGSVVNSSTIKIFVGVSSAPGFGSMRHSTIS
jgi:hypothetical protein